MTQGISGMRYHGSFRPSSFIFSLIASRCQYSLSCAALPQFMIPSAYLTLSRSLYIRVSRVYCRISHDLYGMLASVSISFVLARVVFFPVTISIRPKNIFAAREYRYLGLARLARCSFLRSICILMPPVAELYFIPDLILLYNYSE